MEFDSIHFGCLINFLASIFEGSVYERNKRRLYHSDILIYRPPYNVNRVV